MATMQCDEAARIAVALQIAQRVLRRVKRMGIDAARAQRLQHAAARHQRHLALGRVSAHQDGDLAQRFHVNI